MKKKDLQSWHEKPAAALKTLLGQKETELLKMRLQLAAGKLKNVRAVKAKKHEIAVLKTLLTVKLSLEKREV